MNIYFCSEADNQSVGLYIIAPSRGAAKQIYEIRMHEPYIDIRSRTVEKDILADASRIIAVGDPLLKQYDLKYYDEKGEPI